MKEEIITANAEAVSESAENQSTSDFVRRRSQKLKETSPEASKESAEDSTEATEAKAEVVEEMSEDNVLSQFNLDEMSEEEIISAVFSAVEKLDAKNLKDMGRMMAHLREHHAGCMDFGKASALLKKRLGGG